MLGRPTAVSLVKDLIRDYDPRLEIDFCFDDFRIRVVTNSQAVIDHLGAYHRNFVEECEVPHGTIRVIQCDPPKFDQPFTEQPREAGKARRKEEYLDFEHGRVIRKVRTGMVFIVAGPWQAAVGPCESNLNQIVNFIDSRLMQLRLAKGGLLLHAAGVSQEGVGLAMGGTSGMGKSTLALHLVSAGMQYISNDRLIVDTATGGLVAFGVPKKPRVNPGTILGNPHLLSLLDEEKQQRYAALEEAALWELEDKYDVDLDRCFGPYRQELECRLAGIVILTWERNKSGASLRAVSGQRRVELIPAIMKSPGVFFEEPIRRRCEALTAQDYVNFLDGCPMFELTGGVDFEWATRACQDLLVQLRSRARSA